MKILNISHIISHLFPEKVFFHQVKYYLSLFYFAKKHSKNNFQGADLDLSKAMSSLSLTTLFLSKPPQFELDSEAALTCPFQNIDKQVIGHS